MQQDVESVFDGLGFNVKHKAAPLLCINLSRPTSEHYNDDPKRYPRVSLFDVNSPCRARCAQVSSSGLPASKM